KDIGKKEVDIILDAGHGGNDHGAESQMGDAKISEKDLTLQTALELKEALIKQNLKVLLIRDDDFYLTLPERTRLANFTGGELFLSLHMNSSPQSSAHGYQLFILSLTADDTAARTSVARENQMIPEDLSESYQRPLADLRARANFESSLA